MGVVARLVGVAQENEQVTDPVSVRVVKPHDGEV